jgi:hypothetical protein
MTRKTVGIVLFVAMMLAIIVFPAFVRSDKAIADTTGSTGASTIPINSAEFVIGMNQYFVNNQTPGISMDAAPYIDPASGRTLVPVRYLADALGATTNWDADTQEVTVATAVYNIAMTIGSTTLAVNGQAQTMDVAPVINNGRTYLPARWVAEALGYQVDWNAQYQIVIIWPNGTPEPDISNVITQAQQKPTVVNGFNIPAGTNLDVDTTPPAAPGDAILEFAIDGSKGDVQGQIADAQNILSQTKYLDPAAVAAAMTLINSLTTVQNPTFKDLVVWNSSNGGSVEVYPTALDMYKGNCMIGVQIFPQHLQPSKYYTID